jgi:GT2 family glycosyltransferase
MQGIVSLLAARKTWSALRTIRHILLHARALLLIAITHPLLVARCCSMGLFYLSRLGYGRTATKVSSRLRRWLAVGKRDGCVICRWVHRSGHEYGPGESRRWLNAYRPGETLLARFRLRRWPAEAPTFTIVMPVFDPKENRLRAAIASVRKQTYSRWELVCVDDGSRRPAAGRVLAAAAEADARVRIVRSPVHGGVSAAVNRALGEAAGDYICFLEQDDALEPQALHRFAEAVLQSRPDLLYSDEAVCGANLKDVRALALRPAFSYYHYLSHPYLVHLIGVRTDLLRQIGGFDESLPVSQDIDMVLRVLERAKRVTHVPEILYRWRTNPAGLGHATKELVDRLTPSIISAHLTRVGIAAEVRSVRFNFRDVAFRPARGSKVAIVIPTKNQAALLRVCLASLERTIPKDLAEVFVLDHRSDEAEALELLKSLRRNGRVIDWSGPFNFSAMMNHATAALPAGYTHYLFLNNDTEALEPGWLEHMVGLASQPDVGVVGPILLYPDRTVQHAGVVAGLFGCAEHMNKFAPLEGADGSRAGGPGGIMHCTRDVTAVTGACLLIRADVFAEVDGFDESLAVGFGDTDLCLRVRGVGRKVILDANSVLLHHESISRGKMISDPHPADTKLFLSRYRQIIRDGDPFYSPHYLTDTNALTPNPEARAAESIANRLVTIGDDRSRAKNVSESGPRNGSEGIAGRKFENI